MKSDSIPIKSAPNGTAGNGGLSGRLYYWLALIRFMLSTTVTKIRTHKGIQHFGGTEAPGFCYDNGEKNAETPEGGTR